MNLLHSTCAHSCAVWVACAMAIASWGCGGQVDGDELTLGADSAPTDAKDASVETTEAWVDSAHDERAADGDPMAEDATAENEIHDADAHEASSCTAGSKTCVGNVPAECTADGGLTKLAPCTFPTPVCRDGACGIEPVCGEMGWCWQSPSPIGVRLWSVHGFASDNVWAVGQAGVIVHWDGVRWQEVQSPTTSTLREIFGVAPDDLWVVGGLPCPHPSPSNCQGPCELFHWDGATWTKDSSTAACMTAMWGATHNDLWGADGWSTGSSSSQSYAGAIRHFDGAKWSTVQALADKSLSAIWGTAADDVWAAGRLGTALHFDGTEWKEVDVGTTEWLHGAWTTSVDDVWFVGSAGASAHHDGTLWTTPTPATQSDLVAVWSGSPTDVWASSSNPQAPCEMLRWNGSAWSAAPAGFQVTALWGNSADDAWAVGDGIAHLQAGTWTGATAAESATNLSLGDVWGSSANDVWAVGPADDCHHPNCPGFYTKKDLLLHWDGTHWTRVLSGSEQALMAVSGSSSTDVWAVGTSVLHWDGAQWSTATVPVAALWRDVWVRAPSDVWIVGNDSTADSGHPGLIAHWDGVSWSVSWSAPNTSVQSIWGSSADDVWALASKGIMHWDGVGWTEAGDGSLLYLLALSGTASNDVWAVGTGGRIEHWDGSKWTTVESNTTENLVGVFAASPDDAWAVGKGDLDLFTKRPGIILHWDGATWSRLTAVATPDLFAVWGPSKDETWAVGYQERILHRRLE